MPDTRAARFVEQYELRPYDAGVLTDSRQLADYYEKVVTHFDDARAASNWIQTELLALLKDNKQELSDCLVTPEKLGDLLGKVKSGDISGKMAKTVFEEMFGTGKSPETVIEEKGLVQVSDESLLIPIVEKVIAANPDNVAKYRAGNTP